MVIGVTSHAWIFLTPPFTVIFPHRISSSLPLFYYHILLSMFKFTFVCISGAFISCFHKSFDTTFVISIYNQIYRGTRGQVPCPFSPLPSPLIPCPRPVFTFGATVSIVFIIISVTLLLNSLDSVAD